MNRVRGCKVIADFSIIPIGQGETSVGRFVAVAISAINGVEGLKCEITPMGTVMEADSLECDFSVSGFKRHISARFFFLAIMARMIVVFVCAWEEY